LDPQGIVHQQQEQHSTHQFLQQLAQRHTSIPTTLKEAQDSAKKRHEKQSTSMSF
jgi:hypothetical protein